MVVLTIWSVMALCAGQESASQRTLIECADAAAVHVLRTAATHARPLFEAADAAQSRRAGLERYFVIDEMDGVDALILSRLEEIGLLTTRVDGAVHSCSRIPDDPDFPRQYSLLNTGQVVGGTAGQAGADIGAPEAWSISVGSPSIAIAILDTGVSPTHPDLATKIISGKSYLGNIDAWDDDNGHGTHSAGIAAARSDNAVGIAGVCWECPLVVAKVLDGQGVGSWSNVAAAIVWASDQPLVKVICLNLGGTAPDPGTRAAVSYAVGRGQLVVAAAGNTNGGDVLFPAQFSDCIAVSATDHRDQLATFSAIGPEVDIAAPGADVFSSFGSRGFEDTYAELSGTSMSAPHVAGAAALLWSINADLAAARVRQILESTAKDLGPTGRGVMYGAGRLNLARAARTASYSRCSADVNIDGSLDLFDYLDFVSLFVTMERGADFNGDGAVDVFDYLDFMSAFAQGC